MLEIRNTLTDINNPFEELISRISMAEERISELEEL